jgi:alkyl sulfatase BDS1-like metallo-beta-lactamase superfamily hydrolase
LSSPIRPTQRRANTAARALAADAFEQMGYLAEAAPWRNSYLLAAQRLRAAPMAAGRTVPAVSPEILHVMPVGEMFDYLGTRIDGPRAGTRRIVIAWRYTDTKESVIATLQHGALTVSSPGKVAPDAMVTTTRAALEPVILGRETLAQAAQKGGIAVTGDEDALSDFWALLVDFKTGIPLIEPR